MMYIGVKMLLLPASCYLDCSPPFALHAVCAAPRAACVCVYVYVHVCVREREREREGEKGEEGAEGGQVLEIQYVW